MPELPEVENVRQGLSGVVGQRFARVERLRKNLRTPLSAALERKLPGQTVLSVRRRAKFLLFETEDYILLSHLGMTGSWRHSGPPEKHDHVVLHFESGFKLIYNDPRRFGVLELFPRKSESKWLLHLGVEPLEDSFNAEYLFARTRGRKVPLKGFLMDQRQVVGVGNIYASEALFRAGVKPLRPAGKLTRAEAERLVEAVRAVLNEAVAAGGSTIRDYRNSEGESGRFQKSFAVYDREGEACATCGGAIRAQVIAGRNSFWCPRCQR